MSATRAVTRLTVRQVRVGAIVLSLVSATFVASTVKAREATEAITPGLIEDLASNPALRALYGTPFDLSTPGGFTVWRVGMFLAGAAALWAMLAATRILRGEEEAGRAELVLTGPVTRPRLTDLSLLVLGATTPLVGVCVALTFIGTAQAVTGSVLYSAGLMLVMLDFVGVGGVASQLFGQRRRASGAAGLVLGGVFLTRMVADGSSGLRWLRWFTPFGWLEELRPFADNRFLPLLLLGATAVILLAVAVALSRRRDLGDGIVSDRDEAEMRPRLLRAPLSFQWRQGLTGLLGWGFALFATGLVFGGILGAFTEYIAKNPDVQKFMQRFGLHEVATPGGFVGSMDVFAAMAVALYVVTSLNRVWEDEQERRVELSYPAPITRPRWLGASVLSAVAVGVLISCGCAVATWLAVVAANGDLSFADALAGIANTFPAIAMFLGVAVMLLGIRPDLERSGGGGFVVGALAVSVFGPLMHLPDWVLDLSPFHHLAAVPAQPVDWGSAVVLCTLALALLAGGFVTYTRRDLRV
ncbi:MAG TPA: hypothetical protein VK461_08330 [Acidimicrobiales bacterium]|nr:hypothetical protein [Acidimicrobiales bacterium]